MVEHYYELRNLIDHTEYTITRQARDNSTLFRCFMWLTIFYLLF